MSAAAALREPSGASVLLVEDEGVVATHVQRSLQDAGYSVVGIASNLEETLDCVSAQRPDVALVDIRLRGKADGIQIAERLRAHNDVPVVYMTAHTDDDTLQRAARTGAYGYVVKPFTIGEVKSALEVALHKHRLDTLLAERERWFSTTLRAIADAVVTCDVQQRVTFVNVAAELLLGRTENELLGSHLAEVLSGSDGDSLRRYVLAALEHERVIPLRSDARLTQGDKTALLEGAVAPILHSGAVLGAVLVLRDVTEQRRRDEQLALTDRLSSLGTLVASVAHEINNPLAYNLGNLSVALGDLSAFAADLPDPAARGAISRVLQSLRDAEHGANRVAEIVRQLRAFGRMEELSLRAVDPRACVDWALKLTSNQVLHQARLITNLRDVPKVTANELKLSQVIVNLLSNAAESLSGTRDVNEITVSTWTDETGAAIIEVEDTGEGIPPEILQRIFEPFFTTKARGTGTGLGLSICRTIVQGFGGEISAESQLGVGSRFRVSLPPKRSESRELPAASSVSVRAAPTSRYRILLIDDEPLIRSLVAKLLATRHEVTCVENVPVALATLHEARAFDLVLCDVMMPGQSGIDFYHTVQGLYPELVPRLAFITGGAFTPQTSKFLETAARPVLAKPFTLESLLRFIEECVTNSNVAAASTN
jgi:PAS domain S-box-containing protein